jgi:gluconolactonase
MRLNAGARADQVGRFIQLSGGTGPDGMAADANGNIVLCHVGLGAIWLFSPIGEPLYRINTSKGLAVTNVPLADRTTTRSSSRKHQAAVS